MTPNKVIHETNRLRIMSAIISIKTGEEIDFGFLKRTLNLSDGNLSVHLSVLQKNGYIKIKKLFVGKKPKTLYSVTSKGRKAFNDYIAYLESIIKQVKKH